MSVIANSSTTVTFINGLKVPSENDSVQVYCADLLRWNRKRQGISVDALAKKAGVSRMFIIRAEKYRWQSLKKMFAALRAVGVEVKGIEFAPIKKG